MRLRHITNQKNAVLLFDFENYFIWFKKFSLSSSSAEDVVLMNDLYLLFNSIIVPETTGICLSPHFGWDVLHTKPARTGVIFSLEQKIEQPDPLAHPTLSKQWTMEHIANNYGIAKLQLYYHPEEELSMQKRRLVAELYEFSQYCRIDFILELKVKGHTQFITSHEEFLEAQLLSIKHFRQSCDALILEDPVQALSAATITAEVDIPWYAEQLDFTTYEEGKEKVRMIVENGARGTVIGCNMLSDLILPEKLTPEALDELRKTIATKVRDRVLELMRIIDEGQNVDELNFQS